MAHFVDNISHCAHAQPLLGPKIIIMGPIKSSALISTGFPRSGKRSGIIFSIPDLEKVGKNDFFQ